MSETTKELERLVRDAKAKKGNAAGWLLKLDAKETLSNMGQALAAEVLAGRKRDIAARKALEGVLAVVNDSAGVAGWHLNGDVAAWGEFDFVLDCGDALAAMEVPDDE